MDILKEPDLVVPSRSFLPSICNLWDVERLEEGGPKVHAGRKRENMGDELLEEAGSEEE
jgi:hypothetical protein